MGRRSNKSGGARRTVVAVIQDASGSMYDRRDSTVSGYNEYIDTLRSEAEGEVVVTLTQFDTRVRNLYTGFKLAHVPRLTNEDYVPGGMTALYDAVGRSIRDIEHIVRKGDKVFVVIMTDGGENSSREYRHQTVLDLLERKRRDGWEFVFLGAGDEAWAAGQSLGFNHQTSIFYNNHDAHSHALGIREVASSNVAVTRGATAASYLSSSPVKTSLETASGAYASRTTGSPVLDQSGSIVDWFAQNDQPVVVTNTTN